MVYKDPLSIRDYFLLCGRHFFCEEWDDKALDLLYKKVESEEEKDLKELARQTHVLIRKSIWEDIERIEVSKNAHGFSVFDGELDTFHYKESTLYDTDQNIFSRRVHLKPNHFLNRLEDYELFDKNTKKSVVEKYKSILVSEAILKYLNYIGEPRNNEELAIIICDSFEKVFKDRDNRKSLDIKMVRENVSRMIDLWKLIKS